MKACLNCQKEYENKREASKFCSDKCRVSYNRKHPKQASVSPVQVQVLYNAVLEMVGKIGQGVQSVPIAPKTAFSTPSTYQPVPKVAQDAIMRKYVDDRRDCSGQEEYLDWVQRLEADTRISDEQKELVKKTH